MTDAPYISPLDQARILSEALPHMQQYDEETIVIKYGGHAMGAEDLAKAFARDIVLLEQTAINPVVVHGGGPQIAQMLQRLGIKSEFAAGLRITDAATIEIVEMVLAGSINKQLVGYINEAGGKAVGLCGKDGNMVTASKVTRTMVDPDSNIEKVVDLGFVGEPEKVDLTLLNQLIGHDLIPVLAPLATSRTGQTFNVNADTFAGAVAGALKAKRLLLLTDVPGVLDKSKKLIPELSVKDARKLIADGTISGGMIPKVETCIYSLEQGVAGRRHHRRQDAARGLARIVHQPRHRHADPQVMTNKLPSSWPGSSRPSTSYSRQVRNKKDVDARRGAWHDGLDVMRMFSTVLVALPAALICLFISSAPAHADLKLCNRMSYVVEAAIGIDDKAATATRGWFRIDPAACRVVAQGTLTADRILLNARALGVYGSSPIPQNGGDTLCIAPDNFVIAAARQCRSGQTPGALHPDQPRRATDDGNLVAYLAEDSEYDDEQARLAGIQRLLVIAGYDAAPIDGVDGPKTQAALAAFLKNRGLTPDIVQAPNFFTSHDRRGAVAVLHRADLVQRHAAQDHGRGRHRRRQDRDQPRLVSHRSRQMPASRRHRPAQADLQFRRGRRCRKPRPQVQGQAAELGRRDPALHAREQVRDQ